MSGRERWERVLSIQGQERLEAGREELRVDVEGDGRLRVTEEAPHLEDVRSPGDPEGRSMVTVLIDGHAVVDP
jgi:hypothetical protein